MCKKCKEVLTKNKDFLFCPYCGDMLRTDRFDQIINQYTNDYEIIQVIMMFIDMRVKKKKKPTNHALDIILNRVFNEWELSKDEILYIFKKSIVSGWTDIYYSEIPRFKGKGSNEKSDEDRIMHSDTDYNDIYKIYPPVGGQK